MSDPEGLSFFMKPFHWYQINQIFMLFVCSFINFKNKHDELYFEMVQDESRWKDSFWWWFKHSSEFNEAFQCEAV